VTGKPQNSYAMRAWQRNDTRLKVSATRFAGLILLGGAVTAGCGPFVEVVRLDESTRARVQSEVKQRPSPYQSGISRPTIFVGLGETVSSVAQGGPAQ